MANTKYYIHCVFCPLNRTQRTLIKLIITIHTVDEIIEIVNINIYNINIALDKLLAVTLNNYEHSEYMSRSFTLY